ncbi:MAG: OmpA family protein [Deltaproteobacteria bacterium]|nr:OmpA family protein [Deltaproteobacteria bacterium]
MAAEGKPRKRRAPPAAGHGGGHHGGAWKVAYADFATAMMAFFLLMWILNAASKDKKEALANFFRDEGPFKIETKSAGGNLAQGGKGVMKDLATAPVKAHRGDKDLEKARTDLQQKIQDSPDLEALAGQVSVKLGPEGLVIEMHEEANHELFAVGSAKLSPAFERLLALIGETIGPLEFPVQIDGHTDARVYGGGTAGYSNWELSSDRANSARRFLETHGVVAQRVASVVGHADRKLAAPTDPWATVNRRIAITLMRDPREEEGEGEGEAGASPGTGASAENAAPDAAVVIDPGTPPVQRGPLGPPLAPPNVPSLPLPFASPVLEGTHHS